LSHKVLVVNLHQSAQMSKTTSIGLTRTGTRCIGVPVWQQWASKG